MLTPSTVGLWNIAEYLVDSDVIISIDYDVSRNDNLIHAEYALIQEDNPSSPIPDKIVRKIIDSLAGKDAVGNVVPDPALPDSEKYGISFRPRQSVFVDSQAALKLIVDNINTFFATTPILQSAPTDSGFYSSEPVPSASIGGYSETVPDLTSLGYLDITTKAAEYKVLVTYDSNIKGWSIYEKADGSTLTWTLVDSQAYNTTNYWTTIDWYAPGYATISRFNHVVRTVNDIETLILTDGEIIKVNDSGNGKFNIYVVNADLSLTLVGMEDSTIVISDTLWEVRPATETRAILNALVTAFTGTVGLNQQVFALIRYALSEQQYLDWAFKTSFITVLHKIRKLEQFANYQKDNQNFVEDFINETKPYRTKIREYLLDYEGDDLWDGDVTDFDLPGYYDVDFKRFRSPSGEQTKDAELWLLPENSQWSENYGLYLSSVVVENLGTGYDISPQVVITGGGGTGATAVADISNGSVRRIRVTSAGSGYTSTPTITLTGGNGTGASASARMANDTTRKISTTIKFDRITFTSDITDWVANTGYTSGDIVSYNGEAYSVNTNFTSGSTFDGDNLTVVTDETFTTANDRTLAFYQPSAGMPSKQLDQLFKGISYPGVNVVGGYPIAQWESTTSYLKGDLIARTGDDSTLTIYRATADFTSEASFATGNLEVATVPGLDGKQQLPDSEYDSLIRSTFTDLTLGTRPQDINIDGGEFVDVFSSHAPEELVPGIVFDTLDMKVFTLSPATAESGAGPNIYMYAFRGDGSTTVFDVAVVGVHADNVIVYTRQSGYRRENVGYTYDRTERVLTFALPPTDGDYIYIYLLGTANVNELHDEILVTDGSTAVFNADNTKFSNIGDSFITINGIKTTAYELSESPVVGTAITFDTAPLATDHVHVFLFNNNSATTTIKSYSEFYTQFLTTGSSPVYPTDYTVDLDQELKYDGPYSANIMVEVNNVRLRPANNSYYTGDGSTIVFFVPNTVDINPDTISDNDIDVYLAGELQEQGINYNVVSSDGSSLRSVEFYNAPAENTAVVVSLQTGAEFRMNSNQQLLIDENFVLAANATIKIVSFSDHDMLQLNTQVFIGSTGETIINEPGFDEGGFDSITFDADSISVVSRPVYTLQRAVTDTNYVWATVNGVRMLPNYDFVMREPTTILFSDSLDISGLDTVVVTTFTENTAVRPLGFRIFQNMVGEVEYLRISEQRTSTLAQDLVIDDDLIYVTDASAFAEPSPIAGIPGVIYIGAERITYYTRDTVNNTLGRLRRSTGGTGAKNLHEVGAVVVDGGADQTIPGTSNDRVWLNAGISTATDGTGLSLSTTLQANFLKAEPSYLPG